VPTIGFEPLWGDVLLIRYGEGIGVKRILVLAAVVAVALALSSGAFADGLTCSHGSTSCQSGNLGEPHSSGKGTLPFTGLDLAGIAAAGGLLIIGGFALQRASRRRS
jgi:hypothetical protein